MLEQKEITIGENSFQFNLMNAWDANLTILQLRKIVTPAMREFKPEAGTDGKPKPITEQPVIGLIAALIESMSAELFEDVVFKLFARSAVVCTTKKKRITNPVEFSLVFDGSGGLLDAYKLILEILKENFSGFFMEALNAYGGQASTEPQISIPRTLAQ